MFERLFLQEANRGEDEPQRNVPPRLRAGVFSE